MPVKAIVLGAAAIAAKDIIKRKLKGAAARKARSNASKAVKSVKKKDLQGAVKKRNVQTKARKPKNAN